MYPTVSKLVMIWSGDLQHVSSSASALVLAGNGTSSIMRVSCEDPLVTSGLHSSLFPRLLRWSTHSRLGTEPIAVGMNHGAEAPRSCRKAPSSAPEREAPLQRQSNRPTGHTGETIGEIIGETTGAIHS